MIYLLKQDRHNPDMEVYNYLKFLGYSHKTDFISKSCWIIWTDTKEFDDVPYGFAKEYYPDATECKDREELLKEIA